MSHYSADSAELDTVRSVSTSRNIGKGLNLSLNPCLNHNSRKYGPELVDLRLVPRSSRPQRRRQSTADPLLESIGRETYPICIVDFEDGDGVRVLPCEGKHVFHQACVNPWLVLELSSSCLICRHDKKYRLSLFFPASR